MNPTRTNRTAPLASDADARWDETTAPSADGGRRLRVSHRPGETAWVRVAVDFMAGRHPGLSPVSSAATSSVEVGRAGDPPQRCYFKRFRMRGGLDLLKHCFRPSRARRALRGGNLFAAAGFRVPRPLCLVEERAAGVTVSSVLVTAEVPGWKRLADALARQAQAGRADATERRALVTALAREVAAIHNAGLVHGDMRGGNVGFVPGPDGPRFFWMDNEGCRRPALQRRRLQARNLVQLSMLREGVTQADRLMFWRIYCRARGLRGRERRAILARVVRETRRRWAKRGWA